MTPFEAATVVIGVGQVVLIAAGLLFMEAGGRRRARAEDHRHAEMMATLTRQHEESMATLTTQREQATEQHRESMARHEEVMAALGRPPEGQVDQ